MTYKYRHHRMHSVVNNLHESFLPYSMSNGHDRIMLPLQPSEQFRSTLLPFEEYSSHALLFRSNYFRTAHLNSCRYHQSTMNKSLTNALMGSDVFELTKHLSPRILSRFLMCSA